MGTGDGPVTRPSTVVVEEANLDEQSMGGRIDVRRRLGDLVTQFVQVDVCFGVAKGVRRRRTNTFGGSRQRNLHPAE